MNFRLDKLELSEQSSKIGKTLAFVWLYLKRATLAGPVNSRVSSKPPCQPPAWGRRQVSRGHYRGRQKRWITTASMFADVMIDATESPGSSSLLPCITQSMTAMSASRLHSFCVPSKPAFLLMEPLRVVKYRGHLHAFEGNWSGHWQPVMCNSLSASMTTSAFIDSLWQFVAWIMLSTSFASGCDLMLDWSNFSSLMMSDSCLLWLIDDTVFDRSTCVCF